MKPKRILILAAIAASLAALGFQAAPKPRAASADPLIAGFEKSTVASVADAVDQVVGERGFMSHDMRPRVGGKFVGRARTSLIRPVSSPQQATPALSTRESVGMIDESAPGEVGVIVIEDGLDVAGIGGLMATAAKSRAMAGVIVDGGARDLGEIRALGLPVYSRSVVPSSTVSRFAGVSRQQPVRCAGVLVKPGDIIVAGEDGVVRVPQEKAAEVLKRSQEIDERETRMVPYIKQHKALSKVVEIFNRI